MFEKPNFEGECFELDSDVLDFNEMYKQEQTDQPDVKKKTVSLVGSLKIIGGL